MLLLDQKWPYQMSEKHAWCVVAGSTWEFFFFYISRFNHIWKEEFMTIEYQDFWTLDVLCFVTAFQWNHKSMDLNPCNHFSRWSIKHHQGHLMIWIWLKHLLKENMTHQNWPTCRCAQALTVMWSLISLVSA